MFTVCLGSILMRNNFVLILNRIYILNIQEILFNKKTVSNIFQKL